jgi:hypothetical protein
MTIKATYGILIIREPLPTARSEYFRFTDKKWLEFAKKHNLTNADAYGKWYELYLQLCANGLL